MFHLCATPPLLSRILHEAKVRISSLHTPFAASLHAYPFPLCPTLSYHVYVPPLHPHTYTHIPKQIKLLRGISALLRQARIEVIWAKNVSLDLTPLYQRLKTDFLGDGK